MNKDFYDMIKLFAYGATGNESIATYDFDYERVMFYANEQGIWQIVHYAVEQLVKQNKITVDQNLFQFTKMQVLMSCVKNEQKIAVSHNIADEFNKNNIENCIIKGESLAMHYYKPECRVSGDVDMYIGDADQSKACKILTDFGYSVEQKSDDANHYNCFHPSYGELELHTTLYYKIIQETWFKNTPLVTEPFIKYDKFSTLGYTDGCINVALHGINHFLTSGFGLRHIMDFVLYVKKNYEHIDFDRFFSIMNNLKYNRFINIILGIGNDFFGVDCPVNISYTNEETQKIINFIYEGGIFGHKHKDANTFEIYTNMRIANSLNTSDSNKVMSKWRRKNVIKALSFAPSKMYIHYPYCRKNKLMLPIAWCNHIGYIFKTAFKRGKIVRDVIKYKPPQTNDIIDKKIELFKELDMI